jgi:hypothetical protein
VIASTTGSGFTDTVVTAVVAEHPLASVIVTKYDVVLTGVTVIASVVAPVLHKYVSGKVPVDVLAVSVVLVPAHTVDTPLMIGVKASFTIT